MIIMVSKVNKSVFLLILNFRYVDKIKIFLYFTGVIMDDEDIKFELLYLFDIGSKRVF